MFQQSPLVSIIIPTFNRAHLIGETLDSVLAQTYQNWECIVVDDGSTDTTAEVLKTYMSKDSRFQYYQRPKDRLPGGNAARNYGFEMSKGEYIQWFDSDDLMVESKLEVDVKNLQSGDYDFTISQSKFFDASGSIQNKFWNKNLWSENALNDFITKKIGWGINSPLWKKSSLKKIDLIFEENLRSGQDFFFHIQAISKKLKPFVDERVMIFQRIHRYKIEHEAKKGNSKAAISLYLLENSNSLGIDKETKILLIEKSTRGICSLYKTKSWKKAVILSLKIIRLNEGFDKIRLFRLFIVGSFFQITSKGYYFLK